MPEHVRSVYEQGLPPPKLEVLDQFLGQVCDQHRNLTSVMKLYTNPMFFLESWIEEMNRQREEAIKIKKARAAKRPKKQGTV